eukprot:6063117-Alexandrium_andersonii.AAC.1
MEPTDSWAAPTPSPEDAPNAAVDRGATGCSRRRPTGAAECGRCRLARLPTQLRLSRCKAMLAAFL